MKIYKDNKVKISKDIFSSVSVICGCWFCEFFKGNRRVFEIERIEIIKVKVLVYREY